MRGGGGERWEGRGGEEEGMRGEGRRGRGGGGGEEGEEEGMDEKGGRLKKWEGETRKGISLVSCSGTSSCSR